MPQYEFRLLPDFFVDYWGIAHRSDSQNVATQPGFGIRNDVPGASRFPWTNLADHVRRLNQDTARENTIHKVLFLTRHGLGYHNVQEAKVGTEAWDNYWSHLEGDGSVTWVDAKLVDEGRQQAMHLGEQWKTAVRDEGCPLPETLYTSPLARCLETTKLVFHDVFCDMGCAFKPVVKEMLRETIADHTCDHRSSRSWIETNYPSYAIESGFSEEDQLWSPNCSETKDEHVARKRRVLEDIWASDTGTFLALTIHSGAISALLRACGSDTLHVREGSTIAVLVAGTRLADRHDSNVTKR